MSSETLSIIKQLRHYSKNHSPEKNTSIFNVLNLRLDKIPIHITNVLSFTLKEHPFL